MNKRKTLKSALAAALAAALLTAGMAVPGTAAAQPAAQSSFAEQFQNPAGTAKPYIRWWVSPGTMEEQETRREVREMAEAGFGGIEVCELSGATLGTPAFVKVMKWALDEAIQCGIQLDFNISTGATIVYPDKGMAQKDDPLSEQGLFCAADDFTASDDSMEYSSIGFPTPERIQKQVNMFGMATVDVEHGFEPERPYTFVAVTAAKKNSGGSYDPDSVVNLTEEVQNLDPADTAGAELLWTAPSAGDWTVFYHYQQATAIELSLFGTVDMTKVIADHLSSEAALEMMGYWDKMMQDDPEFKSLLEQNGGSLFGDSLEIGGNVMAGAKENFAMWTWEILEKFEQQHGYDLTPYLPVIFKDNFYPTYGHSVSADDEPNYDFGAAGQQVVEDYYQTVTALFADEHVATIRAWAESHNMTLRYQVYGQVMDLTQPSLAASIVETESLAANDKTDFYRTQSGIVHMTGSGLFSTESAAVKGLGWAQTWTGSRRSGRDLNQDGTYWGDGSSDYVRLPDGSEDAGLLYHYNRQLAAGVNLMVMHGFSYRSGSAWPGDSTMNSSGNFCNEWDDKTPMWEHISQMTDYLARTQYILQQGQADMDLAVYRKSDFENSDSFDFSLNALERTGYTYDFVSPDLLDLDNAAASRTDDGTVLAAGGPSYKALVLDQRKVMTGEGGLTASDMPLSTAQKILGYAKDGLPVVIVGDAPSETNSFAGSAEAVQRQNEQLASMMAELSALPNTAAVASQDEVPQALAKLGVQPDVRKDAPSALLNFHRTTEEAEYYYLYNSDLNRAISQTVSLQGDGVPYLLNPWNGEITPIAQYQRANGTITLSVDLEPNSNLLLAVAKNEAGGAPYVTDTNADAVVYDADGNLAARVSGAGDYTFTWGDGKTASISLPGAQDAFELDGWSMTIASWSAGETVLDTVKTQMGPYALEDLVPWNEIEGLEDAAGVATYTAAFTMEQGWEQGVGAEIRFDSVSDTFKLKVNGIEITGVDQLSKTADIGKALVKGENTIEVEVASNLANLKSSLTQEFGIVGPVVVSPYRQTVLEVNEPDTPSEPETPENPSEIPSDPDLSPDSQSGNQPTTGDTTPIAGAAVLIALIGASLVVVRKRRP